MTAITKYFVGGEQEGFVLGSHASLTYSTTAATFDADFARCSVYLQAANAGYINVPLTTPQLECWVSFQAYHDTGFGTATACTWFQFLNADLTAVYRLQGVGGSLLIPWLQFQYWNGTAWVAIGSPWPVPVLALHKYDFQFLIANSGGILRAYIDGVKIGELTGDTLFVTPSAIREMHALVTSTTAFTNIVALSEVQILDVTTLGRRLSTLGLSADGANTAWTGAVADINTTGTYTDGTFIESGSAGQKETFVTGDLSATAQTYIVDGLVIAGRALHGATGPQNLYGVTRIGGTDYDSAAVVTGPSGGLVTDFGYVWADFPESPATAVNFTVSEINGLETGWKSAA